MTSLLIGSNLLGWGAAAFLLTVFLAAKRANRDWKRVHGEVSDKLAALEHKHLVADMDASSFAWYKSENARLSRKCEAICRQVRRMKNRGNLSAKCHPIHNF